MVKNNIRDIRKNNKITQTELGLKVGHSKQYITKIENGNVESPRVELCFLIINALEELILEKKGEVKKFNFEEVFYYDRNVLDSST